VSFHDVADERLTPRYRPWRCTCGARCADDCICDRPTEDEDDGLLTAAGFARRWAEDRVQDMREQAGEDHGTSETS
jgi:hypothetical protein